MIIENLLTDILKLSNEQHKENAKELYDNFMQLYNKLTNYSPTILVGIGWKLARFSQMGDNRGISDADMNFGSVSTGIIHTVGFSSPYSFKETNSSLK